MAMQPPVSGAPPGPPSSSAPPQVISIYLTNFDLFHASQASSPAPPTESGPPPTSQGQGGPPGGPKPAGPPGPNGPQAGPTPTNGPGSARPPANSASIQKMLDENSTLIKTISEYQNMGKHAETMSYQWQLHRNLMYLAQMADANQNLQNLLPPPGQVPPPGGMPGARPPGPGGPPGQGVDGEQVKLLGWCVYILPLSPRLWTPALFWRPPGPPARLRPRV